MDGRMLFFLYIAASMIAVTHSQDYTVRFPFVPGRFLVPEDGVPVPVGNRVYVQLPNTTDVLEARIRQSVNTTLDCGLFIDRVTALPVARNFYTYWTVRPRTTEGGFTDNPSNLTAGESASGIEIFGDNDRFLRSANPELSSSARQTNIGLFTCYFCYDEINPLGGGIVRSLCTNSSSDVNIIGTSPTINRNDSTGLNELTIGRNICLENIAFINLKCSQIGTINPEPTSVFTFNGEMIGSNFPQDRDTLSIIPQLLQPPVQGEIRCVLMNRFGNDTETSQLLLNATSDFNGTINGMSNSGCPAGTASNVLCPGIGQQVDLNCATNFMNSFNITRPDSTTVTNRNLSFTMGPNDYGTYTCTGFNECNQSPSTIVLQQCQLPEICSVGPRTGDREPIDNHCFSNIRMISGAVIDCDAKLDCSDPDTVGHMGRKWFIDGVEQSQTSFAIPVSQPGTYSCEITHACGIIRSVVATIPRDPPVITNGTSTVLNPSGPVTVGNTVCIDASVSNPSVQLDCAISNPMNANLTNITWSPGGTTQAGVTSASLTVTMTGTYTCTAANDCGSVNASTVVRNTPAVNVTGEVDGISGNGCSGASSRKRICANVGMSVTIRCAVGPGDTYTITGPGVSPSNNQPLTLTVADNNYGDFTCNSTNPCGSVTDTIRLERAVCPLPDVTVSVQRGVGTIVDPPCLRTDNDLFVSCADSLSGSTVAWYINGVLESGNTGSRQRATVSGNYTCVTTSTCGSVTNTTFIKEAPTVAPGTGISINPGNTPVPAGTRTCISSGVGSLVRLVCNLAFNNESVSDVTFSWSTPGGGSQSSSTITARSPGDYTCTASNPCGSSQATTEVVGRIQQTKGTVTGIDQTIDIGSRLCINSANSVRINCNTDFGTSVTRIWRRDGNVISGVTGSSYDAVPSDVGSAITCAVMNPCGMDSAVTQVITQAPVTINGTISTLNISDNGCDRPGITSTGVDLCPLDGERVEISCSSNEGYTITGPGGSSMDASLVIMNFNLSDSGTYTCRSTSTVCGGAVSTIVVSGSGVPPSISTDTPATATPTLPPTVMNRTIPIGTDICLLETQFVTIDCRTQSGTEPIRFTWTAASTGSRVIANGMRITVNNTDVYTCNATNAFGTSTASSTVERRLSVSLNGVSPQGSRCDQLKRRPPGVDYCAFVGDSVTLSCSINSPTVPTTIYLGSTSSTSDIPFIPILPSAEGNYLCNATNDCGTSSDMLNLRVYDPARIDRQQTLPPPGPNEEVIGAGRPDEPNEVTPGRTVRLFCPFTGIDPANTTWLRVRPDGFTTEIDTSLPAFSINNTGNVSVLIISPFTREFEGTYRCTTTNIAGDDAGDVVLQATVEVIPEWVTSPWSECQPKCHRGMRMRLVHCVDRLSGRRLPDNRCTESKPLTMESCINSGPCFTTPKWITGNWTGCSVSCGGGHRTRSVTCVIPLTGETVPDSRCIDVRKPRDHEYCNDHSCCVSDAYKACKHIAGTHSCSFGYMRTICCWTCRHYHYY